MITEFTEKRHSSRLNDLQEVCNQDLGKLRLLDASLKTKLDKGTLLFCSFYKSIAVVERLLKHRNVPFKEISGRVADRRIVRDWFMKNPVGKVLIITRAGGQCLAKGTEIRMLDGSTKKVEEAIEGDLLMGPDSNSRIVISLARGKEEMYRISTPHDGSYIVNESHILSLRYGSNYKITKRRIS